MLDTPWDVRDYMMRVNYLSPVRLTRAVLPGMLEQGSGTIITHLVYPALINVTSDENGDDALAETATAGELIPSPVMARAIMRQVERGAQTAANS